MIILFFGPCLVAIRTLAAKLLFLYIDVPSVIPLIVLTSVQDRLSGLNAIQGTINYVGLNIVYLQLKGYRTSQD